MKLILLIPVLYILTACSTDNRPVIKNNTLCTSDKDPLRGNTLWLYKYGIIHNEHHYILDPEYYKKNIAYGLNCFRVVCFDPWQKSRGFVSTDFKDSIEKKIFLAHLDSVVRISEQLKLYLIINYHDVGKFDKEHINTFWNIVAPRYSNNEFVVYELFNEPVEWFPKDYNEDFLEFQFTLYDKVKKMAPHTKQILFSFPNTANPTPGTSMLEIVDKSKNIDWKNTVVGFHTYFTNNSSLPIQELKEKYPVFNTEQNIPGAPDLQSMDDEEWGIETMEKLKIGWCTWSMDDYSRFKTNFINGAYKDAKAKGYYWN